MRIGQQVRDPSTGDIGRVVGFNTDGEPFARSEGGRIFLGGKALTGAAQRCPIATSTAWQRFATAHRAARFCSGLATPKSCAPPRSAAKTLAACRLSSPAASRTGPTALRAFPNSKLRYYSTSAFSQTKTVTVAVGASISEKFAVRDFLRGSFIVTAVTTGAINFEVSNDNGTTWDTLTAAAGTFNDITAPAVGKPRALPATLFNFGHARIKASTNQLTADATIVLTLVGG